MGEKLLGQTLLICCSEWYSLSAICSCFWHFSRFCFESSLFIIYINDLMEQELMAGSVLHVYADDILLYSPPFTPHMTSCHSNLIYINTITAWSYANFLSNLTLNSNKCMFMVLSRRWSPSYPVIPLTLGDHPLEQVMSFKYLGIHFSCDLSLSMHVQIITSRTKKVVGLLFLFFTT